VGYPRHYYFVFGGLTATATGQFNEIWQCGVRCLGGDSGYSTDPQALADSIATPFATWWASSASQMATWAKLTFIKVNNINADGLYADPITHEHIYTTQPTGTITTLNPAPVTCRYSWTTAASRGLASRGGIFPPVGLTSGAWEFIDPAQMTPLVTSAKKVLELAGGGTPSDPHGGVAAVVSRGKATKTYNPDGSYTTVWGTGLARQVTGVRIGNVIDIQRRRKSGVPEIYTASAWP
jgi:hypothetical protein